VLTRFGYNDLAYKLLLQDTYPSWLYPVKMGATTIWERWDGIKPDSTFQTPSMNSLNHYAYGAIGDWMYRVMAGLDTYEDGPGYKHSMVKPRIGGGFSSASASLETYYGTLSSKWKVEPDRILFDMVIPPNTTSTIFIPAVNKDDVTEGDKALTLVPGIKVLAVDEGYVVIEVGSGSWHFAAKKLMDEHADYEDYVGSYKVEGGMSDLIEVSLQQGKFFISINSNKGELFPVQDVKDRFTDANSHAVTFQRDADARVVSIRVEVEGTEIIGKKE
jgi:alpha-L-rhamnosidase